MDEFPFFEEDCDKLLSDIKYQEKQLTLKRRWLMGITAADSKKPGFLNDRYLSESLLRKDDITYDIVKSRVEEAFGLHIPEKESSFVEHYEQSSADYVVLEALTRKLDALTNRGLYLVAKIFTRGSRKFCNTRPNMKGIVKDHLHKYTGNRRLISGQKEIVKQLSKVLSEPRNFGINSVGYLIPVIHTHKLAAVNVLDKLESLSLEALLAMRRRLQSKQKRPQLKTPKCGRSRREIIKQVRETSLRLLSNTDENEQMQEPLVKAMQIAELDFKLSTRHHNKTIGYFCSFSTDVTNLQNEIVKAIRLIRMKVRFLELKTLQLILDPEAKVSHRSLRTAIKKMLMEYLFECSDMDVIPNSLFEALAVVNRCACCMEPNICAGEEVDEDVERVLDVSAEMKQVFWDVLGIHELDKDFADAYFEDLEEDCVEECMGGLEGYGVREEHLSNVNEVNNASVKVESKHRSYQSSDMNFVDESMGESISIPSSEHQASRLLNCSQSRNVELSEVKTEKDEAKMDFGSDSENWLKSLSGAASKKLCQDVESKCRKENNYLTIQEVCDETSLIAYNLIGHLLDVLAKKKGQVLGWNSTFYLGGNSLAENDEQDEHVEDASSQDSLSQSMIVSKRILKSLVELMGK